MGLTEEEYIEQEAAVKLETAAPEYTKAVKSIDPNEVAQQPRRIKLSKAQLARLKAIRKLRSKYIRQQYREMGVERRGIDPRGKAEIRICSLSVNHYGSVEDYKKTFGKAKLTERRRIEQSILRQITASKCNLVGLQGFLAPDTVLGTEALNRLAKKLTKMAGGEWQGILGGTVKDSPRNAFLVETEAVRVEQSESVKDFRFVRFGPFELEKMSRLPIKLRVTVKGRDGASDRELLVVNAQMREMFSAKDADSVSAQMQMADGIRQVLRSTKRALEDLEEPPTIVLLVDRQEDANSPSTKILDGRLRLVDFTQSGGCSLEEGKKVVCEPPPGRPADLIGITGSSYDVVPRRITKKVDGVKKVFLRYPKEETLKAERKKVLSRLGEIYLYSEETPLANLNDKQSGKYSAGVTKVYTGQKNSPLVWVDLNW